MQTIKPAQDENKSTLSKVKLFSDVENPPTAKKPLSGLNNAPFSNRKAKGIAANAFAPKTGLQGGGSRRALGDITNATPGRAERLNSAYKPTQKASAAKMQYEAAFARPKEEIWADEGIEEQAGKSWTELRAQQEASENARITASVKAMFAPPVARMELWSPAKSLHTLWAITPIKKPPSRPSSPLQGYNDDDYEFSPGPAFLSPPPSLELVEEEWTNT